MAADRATMQAHLKSCDQRSAQTNAQLTDIFKLVRNVQMSVIGGLATILLVLLGHFVLHIG